MKKEYQKGIMVRLLDINHNDAFIDAYYTYDLLETVKMYNYLKDTDIDIEIPDDTEKYSGCFANVEDIEIHFGNDVDCLSLNLYVTVRDFK